MSVGNPIRSDRDTMADSTPARSTRQTTASGVAGLLGLFACICTIFAGVVTLSDWHEETAQARWPVVAAVVERADLIASARAPKDGGTLWHLRTSVRYETGGEARTATLTSRTAFSEEDAAALQAWAEQHRKGSHIDIRYDPSQPNRAAFASAELASTAGRIHTDLIIFSVAAIAGAGLLALAKVLRAREARAPPAADGEQRGGPVLGLLVAALGLVMTGLALDAAVRADPFVFDNLMGVPLGLMFVFAGILIGLPLRYASWRNLLATLLITCFALTFDWVAFGPGERQFSGSVGGIGFIPGELLGRSVFGFFAIILDIVAIAMWTGRGPRVFGPNASREAMRPNA
jgi:Protein of unknown function (DUF3592)